MSVSRSSLLLASLAAAEWTFSWPYGADNNCVCKRSGVSFVVFDTETECLEAFEDAPGELCHYQRNSPVTEDQCDSSVTISQGTYNSACSGKCTKAVAGLIELTEYFEDCDFEFVTEFEDDTVAVGNTGCFNNLVYGWADFDPSSTTQIQPLAMFDDVPNAARCQELCQDVAACVHFTWRAATDKKSTDAYQNEVHTCVLHSAAYMEQVLHTPLSVLDTKTCDFPKVGDCAGIAFPRESVSLFGDLSCLLCDCVPKCAWESPYHVSGPAFCDAASKDELCVYERPSWSTSTQPPCETEECECRSEASGSSSSTIPVSPPASATPTAKPPIQPTSGIGPPRPSTSRTIAASVTPVGTPEGSAGTGPQVSTASEEGPSEEGTPEQSYHTRTTQVAASSERTVEETYLTMTQTMTPTLTEGEKVEPPASRHTKPSEGAETLTTIELETSLSSTIHGDTWTTIELETESQPSMTAAASNPSSSESSEVTSSTPYLYSDTWTSVHVESPSSEGASSAEKSTSSSHTEGSSPASGTEQSETSTYQTMTTTAATATTQSGLASSSESTPYIWSSETIPLPTTPYYTNSLLPPVTPCPDCPMFISDSDCDESIPDIDDCMPPDC